MIVSSPVPRAKQPRWHESSPLQGLRENDSTPRQWLRARTNGYNSEAISRQVAILTQQMGRYRRRIVGGGASSTSTDLIMLAITERGHSDFFVAKQLIKVRVDSGSGQTVADIGPTEYKVAKAVNVRRSITSQLLYGDTVTYSDDDPADIDNTRIANNGHDPAESQVCLPPYMTVTELGLSGTIQTNAQCVVYAKKATGITGVFDGTTQLQWIEAAGEIGVRAFAQRNP